MKNLDVSDANVFVLTIAIAGILMIIAGVLMEFYNDYKCSTTTDVKWFTENNCMRFVR